MLFKSLLKSVLHFTILFTNSIFSFCILIHTFTKLAILSLFCFLSVFYLYFLSFRKEINEALRPRGLLSEMLGVGPEHKTEVEPNLGLLLNDSISTHLIDRF